MPPGDETDVISTCISTRHTFSTPEELESKRLALLCEIQYLEEKRKLEDEKIGKFLTLLELQEGEEMRQLFEKALNASPENRDGTFKIIREFERKYDL